MAPFPTKPCRSCGAPLIWAVTEHGRKMPVDAQPQKRVIFDGHQVPPLARVVDTYVSHFSTCPRAAQHRKPSAPAAQTGPTPKAR